jgi:hypothetical protein
MNDDEKKLLLEFAGWLDDNTVNDILFRRRVKLRGDRSIVYPSPEEMVARFLEEREAGR